MAVREIERRFDAERAAEIVTLENSLGVQHVLTIHIAGHEACPGCGHLLNRVPGVVDVDAVVKQAIAEFEVHEKRLRAHVRKRPK